ncbi:hypothetical protein HDU96_009573 [Phlyctochytrium bullatum]|nr:hypothetical protein HDU96_009573 [Phlyctochytrium bullatum]
MQPVIIGVACGAFLVVTLAAAIAVFCIHRRRQQANATGPPAKHDFEAGKDSAGKRGSGATLVGTSTGSDMDMAFGSAPAQGYATGPYASQSGARGPSDVGFHPLSLPNFTDYPNLAGAMPYLSSGSGAAGRARSGVGQANANDMVWVRNTTYRFNETYDPSDETFSQGPIGGDESLSQSDLDLRTVSRDDGFSGGQGHQYGSNAGYGTSADTLSWLRSSGPTPPSTFPFSSGTAVVPLHPSLSGNHHYAVPVNPYGPNTGSAPANGWGQGRMPPGQPVQHAARSHTTKTAPGGYTDNDSANLYIPSVASPVASFPRLFSTQGSTSYGWEPPTTHHDPYRRPSRPPARPGNQATHFVVPNPPLTIRPTPSAMAPHMNRSQSSDPFFAGSKPASRGNKRVSVTRTSTTMSSEDIDPEQFRSTIRMHAVKPSPDGPIFSAGLAAAPNPHQQLLRDAGTPSARYEYQRGNVYLAPPAPPASPGPLVAPPRTASLDLNLVGRGREGSVFRFDDTGSSGERGGVRGSDAGSLFMVDVPGGELKPHPRTVSKNAYILTK